jgi:methionyl-tRNA synthetase
MPDRLYITTAIDYVNGQPHLGHAYEKVVTDVIARSRRSLGDEVFFLTGLDEHGQKVQQAAAAEGKEPQVYCDELAEVWRGLVARLQLTPDDFIRTTEPRHHKVVQAVLSRLHGGGHLHTGIYEGWYSAKEETFLTEKDRLPDGSFPAIYGEVVKLAEKNYFFALKPHQSWLIEHIETHPEFIQPIYRRNEILGFLKSADLEDLCISRPRARLSWGIPLPFDPEYVTYVWFDALLNYITVPAERGDPGVASMLGLPAQDTAAPLWPAVHVIGKDILRFHAVYWPILLRAIGLPVPKQILAHGWWQKDGQKLSKSTGNIVEPDTVIAAWGVDAFRYFLVRELDIGPDGNWTDAGFATRYNADLANTLGNFVNRSLSMLQRYRKGVVPAPTKEKNGGPDGRRTLQPFAEEFTASAREAHLSFSPQTAVARAMELATTGNVFVDDRKPFKLAKGTREEDARELDAVLYSLAETCRILAILLWPVIPGAAQAIYAQLGLEGAPNRFEESEWGGLPEGHRIAGPHPLFPRKDLAPPAAPGS